jgi:hypothetical protein
LAYCRMKFWYLIRKMIWLNKYQIGVSYFRRSVIRLNQHVFQICFWLFFSENMDNLKMTGSIFTSILSQEPTFSSIFVYFIYLFSPKLLDFEKCKDNFRREKKHKNLGFAGTRPPRGHQLFIHICFNIVTKKSRKK